MLRFFSSLLVRHHKVAQAGCALAHATVEALRQTDQGKEVRDGLKEIGSTRVNRADRADLLNRFATFDDGFWTGALRGLFQKDGITSLLKDCLNVVLWRGPGLTSLWKRVGDFPQPGVTKFNRAFNKQDDVTRRESSAAWESLGILVKVHRFKPMGQQPVRILAGDDVLDLPAVSSTVDSLNGVFERDVQVHAFASQSANIDSQLLLDALAHGRSWRK